MPSASGTSKPRLNLPRGTSEQVAAVVIANQDLNMTVETAISESFSSAHNWLATGWDGAQWVDEFGKVRRKTLTNAAVTFSLANFPKQRYKVFIRPTSSPETPIIHAGDIYIEG